MPKLSAHITHPTQLLAGSGNRLDGPKTAFTFEELAAQLQRLQPPVAYRLSLDSGVGYKNVRRALEQPLAIRLQTWGKLLRSLHMGLALAARAGPADGLPDTTPRGACAADITGNPAGNLRSGRLALGWSRRELAERAGVGLDAVVSLEAGRGLAGTLSRVCAAMDLQPLLTLPPKRDSLEQLWEERSSGCLSAPAQFPPSRPPRRRARVGADDVNAGT